MTNENLETLKGVVRNITFHNAGNGYTVAKIIPYGKSRKTTVVGNVKMLSVGETVVFRGYWYNDPKHGRQFKFHSYESVVPATVEGIKGFLATKYFDGIGPVLAGRIIEKFGADTIRVLNEEPDSLKTVKGISPKKLEAIKTGWHSHRYIRDIMIFLQSYDISPAYATRIYDKYKDNTIDTLRRNPYQLIKDIRGIGFIKADQVASKLGIEKDAPDRIRAGILFTLDSCVDIGHVYYPATLLVEASAETLDLDAGIVLDMLNNLAGRGEVISDDDRVYRPDLAECETEVARRLAGITGTHRQGTIPSREVIEKLLADIEQREGLTLASQQREAVMKAALEPMLVLTGGPGTGKTTTVRSMIMLFRALRLSVMLCAPTGRAAKRLGEATGMEARTIHRMLEFNPHRGRFTKNEGDPLGAHVVIVDEASMVDTVLMKDFLRAVSPWTTLVIVGDVDQLPSIGPGNVLRDIIDSGRMPTIRLTEIFRQAAESRIVSSAHRINTGQLPHVDNDKSGNFFFIKERDPERIAETIVDMVSRRLPASYGFDPVDDIQVLSPMHKSATGVGQLNRSLQERLNPFDSTHPEVRRGDWAYRIGDKVMQVRNNYDKNVFNGDIGRITAIDIKNERLTVRFETAVDYDFNELDDIVPAYAISVHKSQGSEFRCVVMPVTTQHFIMLKRNLLYTGVTRSKDLAVLIGDMKALAIAVKNDQVAERYTSLKEKLQAIR